MLSSSSTQDLCSSSHERIHLQVSSLEENMRSVNEDRGRVEEDPAIST